MKSKHIPLRKCVACKKIMDKNELIRIVKNKSGNVDIDIDFKKEGRGAYICKNEKCISDAEKKKILNKFLHVNIDENIYDKIRKEIIKN